jgi:hypothetical protein
MFAISKFICGAKAVAQEENEQLLRSEANSLARGGEH